MKNENTLYNVLFPIWFLLIFPVSWLVVLPGNFIIDSIVLLIAAKAVQVTELKTTYKNTIIKVWVFGFIADIVGAGVLFLTQVFSGSWWNEYISNPIAYNPWDNWYAFFYVVLAIIISAVCIYIFNMKISLKKTDLSHKQKRKIALVLAIFTAPYLFLIPSQLTYNSDSDVQFFTNHIIPQTQYDIDVSYTEPETGDNENRTIPSYKEYNNLFIDGVNTADRVDLADDTIKKMGEADASFRFYNAHQDYGKTILNFWFDTANKKVYFQNEGSWYEFNEDYAVKALAAWQDILAGGLGIEFNIIDEAKLNNLYVPQAQEKIYEDSEYVYYLSTTRADKIFIEYFDDISGITQRVGLKKALDSGLITTDQLIDKGLDISAEEKE